MASMHRLHTKRLQEPELVRETTIWGAEHKSVTVLKHCRPSSMYSCLSDRILRQCLPTGMTMSEQSAHCPSLTQRPSSHLGWDSEGSEPNPRHQVAASSVYKPEVRSGEAFAAILRKTYKLHHSAKVQMQHRLHPDGWSKCLRRRAASE